MYLASIWELCSTVFLSFFCFRIFLYHKQYEEWLAALLDWESVTASAEWQAWAHEAFDRFDSQHTGRIGPEEIKEILCGSEACPTPDEVDAALREADVDRDGACLF
jgi:hypothetical protein